MDTRLGGHETREREGMPRSKRFAQKLGALLGLSHKKHPQHQNPSQYSNPQIPYNQQIPGVAEFPNNTPRPSYPVPHGQNYTDAWTAPLRRSLSGSTYPAAHERGYPDMLVAPSVAVPSEPNSPATHGQCHTDTRAAPPMATTRLRRRRPLRKTFQRARPMPPEIIIALMGVTGAGKSYFIREVTGNSEVEVSDDLHSCTSKVQPYSFKYEGAKITLVDTPGFNDTNRSDTEVLQEIVDWTSEAYRKDQLLTGIIYLHPITHTRMEGSALKNLRMLQSLCGQEVLGNVFLTTTQWSNVNPAEAELRENRLLNQEFWGGLIEKGATLERFRGTRESGFELINKLMSKTPKPLDIQDQIVRQNMTLPETNAGKCVNEELIAQEKKFKGQLKSLEKQLREAIKAGDGEMNQILVAEQARALEKLENAAAEQKLLQGLHTAKMEEREAEKKERQGDIKKGDRRVIAVAIKDIAFGAHMTSVFTSYKARGRLIFDIHNREEFESDTFEITINHEPNMPPDIRVCADTSKRKETLKGMFDEGIGHINYIILDGVHYWCRHGTPIGVGGQEFLIFSKGQF